MAAYIVVDIQVEDPGRHEEYKKLAAPTVAAYDGEYVVRGGAAEVLVGEWQLGGVVVLEFPKVERAREWWDSDAYGEAKWIRCESAESNMIVVESV